MKPSKREYIVTSKQERFEQLYVETGNASEAYRRVYSTRNMKDATINKRASELKLNGEVSGRIDQLQAEHRERHNVTVATITAELEEIRKLAIESETFAPAVQSVMGKAKLHGLLIERAIRNIQMSGIAELMNEINGKTVGPPSERRE